MKNYQSIGKHKDKNVCCPSGETHKILIHMGGGGEGVGERKTEKAG